MGYYTLFNVDISGVPAGQMDGLVAHAERCMDDVTILGTSAICGFVNGVWSSWDDDLLELSHQYPDVFIEVSGDGEASEDLWRAYIKDGAMQYAPAKITYEAYDPDKMEEYLPSERKRMAVVSDLI